jgi:hypothetical protein
MEWISALSARVGGGTTLLGALANGCIAIGGDALLEHAEMSARRLDAPVQQPLFAGAAE